MAVLVVVTYTKIKREQIAHVSFFRVFLHLMRSHTTFNVIRKQRKIILRSDGKDHTNVNNRKSPAQFKNRIQPWVNVKRITRSTNVRKRSILLAGTGVRKISSVVCGFNPIKIHCSDYPYSLISRINEVYVFFNKISL